MMRKTMLGACAGLSLSLFAGAAMAVDPPTPFDTDVNTAINRGLDYLSVTGAYSAYPGCGGSGYATNNLARGLPLLALLEKRASGNLNDAPQGYVGASDADKEKMRNAVACILDSVNEFSQEAYYYGNWLGALSLYARTGGPGKGAPRDSERRRSRRPDGRDQQADRRPACGAVPGGLRHGELSRHVELLRLR